MEVLFEIIIVAAVNIATIIFDPFIMAAKFFKRVWDSVNPDNLPDVLPPLEEEQR